MTSDPNRSLRRDVGAALGTSAGLALALERIDVGAARSFIANGQWHRLAADLSRELVWSVPLGFCVGVALSVALRRALGRTPRATRLAPFARALALGIVLASAVVYGVTLLRPVPTGPNVLVVVLDTTRRDHTSLYGFERGTTPNLEAIGRDSAVYTRAYSTSAWTGSSHASLFTGLYPAAHHVTQEAWNMPNELFTLAEAMWEAGYRTAAMVGNPMVGSALGFDQGFERFLESWREPDPPSADAHPAVRGLKELLSEEDAGPFFAFVNLIEPHSPYNSGPHHDSYRTRDGIDIANNHWRAYFAGSTTFTPDELVHLADRYDAEIRYTDDIVGQLAAALEAHGVLDETLLIVTSDHGENFGEHGLIDHVFNLYETTTLVPLLIRYPRAFEAGLRNEPVQIHDIFPTVLGVSGVALPAGNQGIDLSSATLGADRPILLSYGYPVQALRAMSSVNAESATLDRYRRRLWAIRDGDWKLIVSELGDAELYQLGQDPDELVDLALEPEHAETLARLRDLLDRRLGEVSRARAGREPPSPASAQDPETLDELQDLGYAQ